METGRKLEMEREARMMEIGWEMENVNKYGVLVTPKTIFNKFKGTNRSFKNSFF